MVRFRLLLCFMLARWDFILGLDLLAFEIKDCVPNGPTGEALFLTPYIESGRWKEGRRKAEVPPLIDGVASYSGFLTVNKVNQSHLFFWFFPAENVSSTAPVALWLQGGPGSSSMFGIFFENGPFIINADLTVLKRAHSWTKHVNMLFIDNPVGVGFSFTGNGLGYVSDEEQVGRDLYSSLVQFFLLFPELRRNPFFLTGESYAGKYIPAAARAIHINNPTASVRINLQGMAIGDGFIDPENMMLYGHYLFQHGLIDKSGVATFAKLEQQIRQDVEAGRFKEASQGFGKIFVTAAQLTGKVDLYNYLLDGDYESSLSRLTSFMCRPLVRKSVHAGNLTFGDGRAARSHLLVDLSRSVRPWFELLLEHYRVLLYGGQLDVIVPYPATVQFVERLRWSGAAEYATASRRKWVVNKRLAGYAKTARNLTEILVRNAGHMVPMDQPEWALEMIRKFVYNEPF